MVDIPNPGVIGIQVDVHDGSYLQHGISTVYRDAAVRRGIIDGKHIIDWLGELDDSLNPAYPTHDQLRRAVIAALTSSIHATGPSGECIHPTADPFLPLSHVRVWKWGPHAYFELHYRNLPTTLLQYPAATTISYESTYEHGVTFRRVVENIAMGGIDYRWLHGLPNGPLNFPNDDLGKFDPTNRPRPRVWKKAAMRLRVITILDQHPFTANPLSAQFNTINGLSWNMIGTFLMPFTYDRGMARYDGLIARWIGVPTRYKVAYQFTIADGGHFGQALIFGDPLLQGGTPEWYTESDEPRQRFMGTPGSPGNPPDDPPIPATDDFNEAFPVAL